MAGALDRFRVLALSDSPATEPDRRSGDLFAHFGVPIDARAPNGPRPLVEVHACGQCGWLLAVHGPLAAEPCPICGSRESSDA